MKKVLALILFTLALVSINAQGSRQRIALLNLQRSNVVESSRAGQVGLTDNNGNQRYAQYTEIDLVPISYTPNTTGNTQNYSEFVTTISGDIWYIDWQGRGIRLYTPASAGDYDWLEIGNNQIPNSIRDSIYTDNYAAINVRLVWPQAQLLVGDSTVAGNIVALGNRESRIGFYRLTGPNWSSIGQEGGNLVARLGTNTTSFEVQSSGGISPSQPAAPFRSIVRINKDSSIQLVDFKSTRNDTATIRNVLYTDAQGFLQSSMISELPQTPSLYNSSGVLKDTLEAISSNGRAFIARNNQYPLSGGGQITGFVFGKTAGTRGRIGIMENSNETRNEIFSSSVTSTQKITDAGHTYRFASGTIDNSYSFAVNEQRFNILNFATGYSSQILNTLGRLGLSATGGGTSVIEFNSDTLISRSNFHKFNSTLGASGLIVYPERGYAQYSRNVQDSILANDRRLLDVGSLKRYLFLNPPSGGTSNSWNRNGNTGTGTDTLGTTGNFPVNFYTNGSKRMELTSDGKIALGPFAFNGNQASIYTNYAGTKTFTGFGTGHWVNSSALPAIVLDNASAPTGRRVFTIQTQAAGRTTFEYRNDNGSGSPTGAANILVLQPNTTGGFNANVGINVATPTSSLDVIGTIAFRGGGHSQTAAGTIPAIIIDNNSTIFVTYTGVVNGAVSLGIPSVSNGKYITVINVGTVDFMMHNVHMRALTSNRAATFMYDQNNLNWECTTVRPFSNSIVLGSNTNVPSNSIVDNILSINLPSAGTYEVRGQIQGTIPVWEDGDTQVRLGVGASSADNTVGMMSQFSDGSGVTREGMTFSKRFTVASSTNVVLSVNNRHVAQDLTVLANNSATGQGTALFVEKIN